MALPIRSLAIVLLVSCFAPGTGGAGAVRGDLCFPLEGWALVGEWHVGSGVASVRQGWMLRRYPDRGWPLKSEGTWLSAARHGSWLRNAFKFSRSKWKDATLDPGQLPRSARLYLNGREVAVAGMAGRLSLARHLRSGVNSIVIGLSPHGPREIQVPRLEVSRITASGRASRPSVTLRRWRWRQDRIDRFVTRRWLRSSDTTPWRIALRRPPVSSELWIPESPVCLKAVLDFPRYWRGRSLSVFFHEIPGDPDVYINGEKMIDRLRAPARLGLKGRMKFNAHDTLCLVYPGLPSVARPEEGKWGIAAIHWDSLPLLKGAPRSATLLFDFQEGAKQEGAMRALSYAAQLIEVSTTSYGLTWRRAGDSPGEFSGAPGALVAAWGSSPFSRKDLKATGERAGALARGMAEKRAGKTWLLGAPTAGNSLKTGNNSRLSVFRNDINRAAADAKVTAVPLFDVFRSALRCQNRWPCRPSFSDDNGRLTVHGSYLTALAVLELALHDLFVP